jgi:hypothetical protein
MACSMFPWLMLLIVPVRMQDSWCMGPGLASWGLLITASVRLLVVLLVVMWTVVSHLYKESRSLYIVRALI